VRFSNYQSCFGAILISMCVFTDQNAIIGQRQACDGLFLAIIRLPFAHLLDFQGMLHRNFYYSIRGLASSSGKTIKVGLLSKEFIVKCLGCLYIGCSSYANWIIPL
jgi:hypothetical protein